MMKLRYFLPFLALSATLRTTAAEPPRLVVQIVVSSMRAEDLNRYADNFSDEGFLRLVRGGTFYPESHYGRDALVGIALFLSSLAHKGCTASELRATFPNYFIAKNRIDLTPSTDIDAILEKVKEMFANEKITDIDGVKIDFPDKWVHLRKSNTEPIIRVYSEAATMEEADELGKKLMQVVYDMQ